MGIKNDKRLQFIGCDRYGKPLYRHPDGKLMVCQYLKELKIFRPAPDLSSLDIPEHELLFIGLDTSARGVYMDFQHNIRKKNPKFDGSREYPYNTEDRLYSTSDNTFEGEPESLLNSDCMVVEQPTCDIAELQVAKFCNLKNKCDFYLGLGGRKPEILGHSVTEVIEQMQYLLDSVPRDYTNRLTVPIFMTQETVDEYKQEMLFPSGMYNGDKDWETYRLSKYK